MRAHSLPELLAPAGDRAAFLAAVAAGANAVYCGVSGSLNARRKARNIQMNELPELCAHAHGHGARVYVAANVVIRQEELVGALGLAAQVRSADADALICQDWGLMAELRKRVPELELHVSTQANVHDARGVRLARDLGASRVTLSRELSVGEIAEIHDAIPEVELEVFAHGSLCVCYSGLCTLSTFLRDGRSPNRGVCAQPCRLPFDLVDETGERLGDPVRERPLCMADNCAIDLLPQLVDAGVSSLKVEGRMKPAPYVHAVTSAYRREIDALAGVLDEPDGRARRRDDLARSFNRGFTDAYLRGTAHGPEPDSMMSYERSTNRGCLVGVVRAFEPQEGFVPRDGQQLRGEVLVRLDAPVGAGDAVELRPVDDPARFIVLESSRDAHAGEVLRLACPRPIAVGTPARVTRSRRLVQAAERAVAEAEREVAAIRDDRLAAGRRPSVRIEPSAPTTRLAPAPAELVACALAPDLESARRLRAAGAHTVYLDVTGIKATGTALGRLVGEVLAQGFIPALDEVCHEADHARLDPWIRPNSPVLVRNVSQLALARERGALAEVDGCVPAHSLVALRTLRDLGARRIWLSDEASLQEVGRLADAAPVPVGALAYGRPRLATCERCVLQVAGPCDHDCVACELRARSLVLRNIDGRDLPVRVDARGRARIYLDEPLDRIDVLASVSGGLGALMVDACAIPLSEAVAALGRVFRTRAAVRPVAGPEVSEPALRAR